MVKLRSLPAILFCVFVLCAPLSTVCAGQAAPNANPQQRATSTPYSGDLSIFESPDREKQIQPNRVMDQMHITPGSTVADIGAGSGWFTVRFARRVGPGGKVFAEDINPQAITYIQQRAGRESLGNVVVVQGTPDNPQLPAKTIDAVMLMKVYHEIARPVPFMHVLRASLVPGARVGIIDRNGNGSGTDHGVPESTLVHEMNEAGFHKVQRYDFKADGQDYFLIFQAGR
jgi:SAM-dependent methyltransferase